MKGSPVRVRASAYWDLQGFCLALCAAGRSRASKRVREGYISTPSPTKKGSGACACFDRASCGSTARDRATEAAAGHFFAICERFRGRRQVLPLVFADRAEYVAFETTGGLGGEAHLPRRSAAKGRASCPTISISIGFTAGPLEPSLATATDRKSTRLNSSHGSISYAVFC